MTTLLLALIFFVSLFLSVHTKKSQTLVVLVGVALILFFCVIDMKEQFTNYASTTYRMAHPLGKQEHSCRKNKYPLLSETTIFTPTGDGVKLSSDMMSENFPTVDGTKETPKHMFSLAHNQCHIGCCPSDYTCSRGCVCTTKNQRKYINQRGGNRTLKVSPSF